MEIAFNEYFCGNKISDYGLSHGRVDYCTFSKAFNHVLANNLLRQTGDIGYWEQISGDYENEVFQWYIVDAQGAEICQDYDEILYYNEELDLYLWGVDHYGTSWNYVLTDIKCKKIK